MRTDDVGAREGRVVLAATSGAIQMADVVGVSPIEVVALLLQVFLPEGCRALGLSVKVPLVTHPDLTP